MGMNLFILIFFASVAKAEPGTVTFSAKQAHAMSREYIVKHTFGLIRGSAKMGKTFVCSESQCFDLYFLGKQGFTLKPGCLFDHELDGQYIGCRISW